MFLKKVWQKLRPKKTPIPEDNLNLAIQTFWQKVKLLEPSLQKLQLREIMENINQLLCENQLEVIAEISGFSGDEKIKIIFTAEGRIELFEQVLDIVKLAPSFDMFEIEAFRQRANEMSDLETNVNGSSFSLGASDLLIQYHEDRRKISLGIMFTKPIAKEFNETAQTLALVFLDHLLGEYDLATKVQSIDFLDTIKGSEAIAVDQFVARFDQIWKEDLKHTGIFPIAADNDQWFVFELVSREDPNDAILVQRNEAANAMVCDINYGYSFNLSVELESKETLSIVYELEDAINSALYKKGIHCQNILHQATRTMQWQVTDKDIATQVVQQILNQNLSVNIECKYDPTWSQYLTWVK